jgi:SAM-dependent methyltransferase
MSMLLGAAEFIVNHVLGRVPQNGRILSIAPLSLRFDMDSFLQSLCGRGVPYDQEYAHGLLASGQDAGKWTSREFFRLFGYPDYQDIDFDATQDCTIVHDMNHPLPSALEACYDFVLEHGTLEHIFDVKTALGNIARAVRVGGLVCHMTPFNFLNHGYYNFSLNLFNDFYAANGFGDGEFYLLRYHEDYLHDQRVRVNRLPFVSNWIYPGETLRQAGYTQICLGFLARKQRPVVDIAIPIQGVFDPARRLPWKPVRMDVEGADPERQEVVIRDAWT